MDRLSTQPPESRIRVWDVPLRLFHWFLVVAVALAFLSAEEESALNQWHVLAGWVAGILIVFRIAWGLVGGEHSRFASFLRPAGLAHHVRDLVRGRPEPTLGHNPLGAVSVLLLLGLVAATVWSGAARMEELHELIGWTLLGLVGLHVLAVLVMSLLTRDNLLRAMVTGSKAAARHPGASDARKPGWIGALVALLVLGAAIFGVRAIDPLAFTLRSAESYEHAADTGDRGAGRHDDEER